ncbi:MAG: hypothetical protein ACR2J3_00685, partial [Aridibacter sp.]
NRVFDWSKRGIMSRVRGMMYKQRETVRSAVSVFGFEQHQTATCLDCFQRQLQPKFSGCRCLSNYEQSAQRRIFG